MQWPNLLAKFSPEHVPPILREGQCRPVSDYNKASNMPSDHHESPPAPSAPDDPDESSSIGDFSLLAPPMSHRQLHPYPVPQSDLQGLHSFIDDHSVLHDPSATPATTVIPGPPPAHSVPMRAVTHTDYPDGISMPNSQPLSPHATRFHARTPPSSGLPPQQPVVYTDGYAPAESLPPQNYTVPVRTMPPLSAPPPASHGTSLLSQVHLPAPPVISIPSPTVVVPPNSELARPLRFTLAPPGADVPTDPVVSATTVSPTSARSRREKAKGKPDRASQRTQEGSDRRARSYSWSVVPSVFRRISGRHAGPATPTPATDVRPQLTASDWRDLAQWAHRPADNNWGESFEEYSRPLPSHPDTALPVEMETSSLYDRSLPPLPPHLSHISVPSPPLLRYASSTSALNPFLTHLLSLPPLAWDLRTTARAIFFPASGPGAPTLPMAASDYAQPATWPPCGALRIGAVGGQARWLWPVDARNPAGVRCGDVFRALVANLHEFVHSHELAGMPPEQVNLIATTCAGRVAVGMTPGSAAPDGIRRVDCLLGYTHFHGLEPGPSAGEWTMFVGAPSFA